MMAILETFKNKLDFILGKKWLAYPLLLLVTFLVFVFTFRAWKYDYLTYPISYQHDGVESLKMIKHLLTNKHWQKNEQLAFPFGSNLYVDFPTADQFSIQLIKFIGSLGFNHFQTYNLYVLSSYFLVALVSFSVLMKLKLKPSDSFLGALLFSFVPYHQIRAVVGHVFLIQILTVPLTIYLMIDLMKPSLSFQKFKNLKQALPTILWLALIGSIGSAYYAFFSIGIWLIAALIIYFTKHRAKALKMSLIYAFFVSLVVILNVLPSLIYQQAHGKNLQIKRDPFRVQEFSLRLNRVLSPLPGGKPAWLADKIKNYYQHVQHEQYQYLGLVAVIGFIYLLWSLVDQKSEQKVKNLSLVVIGIIVWASAGGLALPLAYLVSPIIRSYGRISLYLAFLGIIAFFWLLERIELKKPWFKKIWPIVFLLVALSLYGQVYAINPHQNYWQVKRNFDRDQQFATKIEAVLQSGAPIFQLPIKKYPEARGGCEWDSYDHFYLYLHSTDLKWFFGAVTGRKGWKWQEKLKKMNNSQFLETIQNMGYQAVMIDNSSCIDSWELQAEISELTQGTLHTSQDFKYILVEFN